MSPWSPTFVEASLGTWHAPHPGWKPSNDRPDGWPEQVGAAAIDAPGAPLVLIDPIAPSAPGDAAAFWSWLAARQHARSLVLLLSNHYHGRSGPEILARYPGTAVFAAAVTNGRASVPVTHVVTDGDVVPGGVRALAIDGLDDGELAWHIPAARSLFFADAILGTASGLRLAPRSWSSNATAYDTRFVASLRRLVPFAAEHVLPSHGPFTPGDGVAKLTFALGSVAKGSNDVAGVHDGSPES